MGMVWIFLSIALTIFIRIGFLVLALDILLECFSTDPGTSVLRTQSNRLSLAKLARSATVLLDTCIDSLEVLAHDILYGDIVLCSCAIVRAFLHVAAMSVQVGRGNIILWVEICQRKRNKGQRT